MKKIISLLLIIVTFVNKAYSQENGAETNKDNNHKVALVFGYTHIPSAFEAGESNNAVFVPTIGVDYSFQFSDKWRVGAVLDLELGDYLVDFDRRDLSRERALVTGLIMGYEFTSNWSFLLGPGIEFEKNENLFILRSSLEYEFEFDKNWGIFPSVNYDFKEEYSSWSINLGISKSF